MHKILSVICPTVTELMAKEGGIKIPHNLKKKKKKAQTGGVADSPSRADRKGAGCLIPSGPKPQHPCPVYKRGDRTGGNRKRVTLGTVAFHPTAK